MHLSKQEFSKLSKADKAMLLRGKQQPKQKKKPAKKPNRNVGGNAGTSQQQRSVAAAYSTGTTGRAPIIKATRDSCRVQHREFIGNITGTTAFALTKFSVNPGISATFPWLSTIAPSWEEFRFRKLVFRYLTRTGSNVPGSVIIAPDYDASDADPASEQVLSSYEDCRGDAPWKDILCVLQRLNLAGPLKRHFVRSAALAANEDIKLYDVANLFVATTDGTAVSWGKLWVEYDVEFFVPQLPASGAIRLNGGLLLGNGTITKANPFGVAPLIDTDESGLSLDAASILTFESLGTWLLSWNVIGTTLVASTDPVIGAGVALIANSTTEEIAAAAATSCKRQAYTVSSLIGATVNFGACYSGAATITAMRMYAAKAPTGSFS